LRGLVTEGGVRLLCLFLENIMKTLFWTLPLLLFVRLTLAQDFVGHTHDILKVQFNPDATELISYSAGDGWFCLWEVKSGRLLWRSKTGFIQKADEYYTLTSFAFSPDQHLTWERNGPTLGGKNRKVSLASGLT
jgi:WD40 repeat protein